MTQELREDIRPELEPTVEHRWFGRYGVVSAPAGGSYLRLDPVEFHFTMALDGTADRKTLTEAYGPDADDWLDLLWEEGFLIGSPKAPDDRLVVTKQGIEFSGADRVMRLLYRVFGRWAFTIAGAVVLALLSVLGIALFGRALTAHLPLRAVELSPIVAVIVIEVMGWTAMSLHELGHGFVLIHAGRRVGRVGMGFYWGLLSFYVDASDGMLADRRTRMLQAAAGSISDLFWAGVALSLTLVVGVHSPTADLLRQFAVLQYVTIALNAVPLLELDGYHFLADFLDRPGLKAESDAAVHDLPTALRDPQRRGLALYGVASIVFGTVLLIGAAVAWWHVFGSLVTELIHGSPLAKGFGIYFVLPYLVMVGHLAATAHRALKGSHHDDGAHQES